MGERRGTDGGSPPGRTAPALLHSKSSLTIWTPRQRAATASGLRCVTRLGETRRLHSGRSRTQQCSMFALQLMQSRFSVWPGWQLGSTGKQEMIGPRLRTELSVPRPGESLGDKRPRPELSQLLRKESLWSSLRANAASEPPGVHSRHPPVPEFVSLSLLSPSGPLFFSYFTHPNFGRMVPRWVFCL